MTYKTLDGKEYYFCTQCYRKDFKLFPFCPNCNQRQRKHPRTNHNKKDYERI